MPDITGVVAFNVTRLAARLWDTAVVLPNLSNKLDVINAQVNAGLNNPLYKNTIIWTVCATWDL